VGPWISSLLETRGRLVVVAIPTFERPSIW
jgi:hypothetical protein